MYACTTDTSDTRTRTLRVHAYTRVFLKSYANEGQGTPGVMNNSIASSAGLGRARGYREQIEIKRLNVRFDGR